MAGKLRHVSFGQEPAVIAQQAGENARDAFRALDERVAGNLRVIARYAAVGATTARIFLPQTTTVRPRAVVLARAYATNDPGTGLVLTPVLNFYHDSRGIGVYEPSGLVANTMYNLTFLILE